MDSHKGYFTIAKMALYLGVSTRSYYDYCRGLYLHRASRQQELEHKITTCFYKCKELYGSVRLSSELQSENTCISRVTTAKYMQRLGLRSKLSRKFKVCATDSNHSNLVAKNLLDRKFTVSEANKVWISDITYIRVLGGGLECRATIMDIFDRKVIGWSFSSDMITANTVMPAFKMACKVRCLSGTVHL